MRSSLLAITLCVLCAACSFEPVAFPGEPTPDLRTIDPRDASEDIARGDQGTDLEDMTPDVAPDLPADMPRDVGPDLPPDMPDDMPIDTPQDLPGMDRTLGQPCETGDQCASGQCRAFSGVGRVCTEACAEPCADPGFVCFGGVCTPAQTCDDAMGQGMGTGPGCDGCDKCAATAACVDVERDGRLTQSCLCEPGFEGDGFVCLDVDECAADLDDCDARATCLNTLGGFDCACDPGFEGDGRTCTPIDPCLRCDTNARCVQGAMGRECVCDTGYEGDGRTCVDIDECMRGTDGCDPLATCSNVVGSFACTCPMGYEGDGLTCADIDECMRGTDGCQAPANCENTPGSFVCACPPGSLPQGSGCQLFASCAQIKANFPASGDGNYFISSPQGPLKVYCDMTIDGGAGYTLVRFDDPANLGASQASYGALCAQYGLEVVVPRTPAHLDVITTFNGAPPNLIGVRPAVSGAPGISGWTGSCQGMPCSFHVTSRETTQCKTLAGALLPTDPGRWSDGTYARSCQEYLTVAAQGAVSGLYQIDLDGSGPSGPMLTFCDMTTDGGGWTLGAIVSDDGVGTWTWNARALWTTDTREVGSLMGFGQGGLQDYKNRTIHEMPFRDLLFAHSPSSVWASYHGVSNGVQTLSQVITNTAFPNCEPTSGYPMTAGTLVETGSLCSTSLYFNIGDYDGARFNCNSIFGPFDQSTFGPSWSIERDNGCPFDDPARGAWGADFDNRNTESDAMGYGWALGLNTGTDDASENFLGMSLREERVVEPSGQNTIGESLILVQTPADGAGPACPNGSFEDRGDDVVYRGYVLCAANGR